MEPTNNGESLSETIARWHTWQATTCNPSTIGQRSDAVERLREDAAARTGRALADVDPRLLTADDLSGWLGRPELGANSRATYYRHVAAWFGWLHRTGRIAVDPMAEIRRPRIPRRVPKSLTAAEVSAVFAGVDGRLRAVLLLALHAGLRSHEVAGFRGEMIRGRHLELIGKGNVESRIPLAPALLDLAAVMPAEGWWFPSPAAGVEHICSNHVGEMVRARFRAVGIPKGSIHRLRHTYGTLVQKRSGNIRITQQLMRHASLTSTMIYTDVDDDEMFAALGGLPAISA